MDWLLSTIYYCVLWCQPPTDQDLAIFDRIQDHGTEFRVEWVELTTYQFYLVCRHLHQGDQLYQSVIFKNVRLTSSPNYEECVTGQSPAASPSLLLGHTPVIEYLLPALRHHSYLQTLQFTNVRFNAAGLAALVEYLKANQTIRTFRFNGHALDFRLDSATEYTANTGLRYMMQHMIDLITHNHTISHYQFMANGWYSNDIEEFCHRLEQGVPDSPVRPNGGSGVRILNLSYNPLDEDVGHIIQLLHQTQFLHVLHLSGCHLTVVHLRELFACLQHNQNLVELFLNNNNFSMEENPDFTSPPNEREKKSLEARSLQSQMQALWTTNKTLTVLGLNKCHLSDLFLRWIITSLITHPGNTTVQYLDLSWNQFTDSGVVELCNHIQRLPLPITKRMYVNVYRNRVTELQTWQRVKDTNLAGQPAFFLQHTPTNVYPHALSSQYSCAAPTPHESKDTIIQKAINM